MAEAASVTPAGIGDRHLRVAVEQRFAGGFVIDARLDADLDAGSVLVLFGPSGAGKTTILRHLAGLERPDAGLLGFGGSIWCDTARQIWTPPQARRIGLVFQQPTLFPHLTVRDNVRYGIRSGSGRDEVGRSASGADHVGEIEEMLGTRRFLDRYPRALSGGEAQRVALARALATGPRLLLLDEPFASLDAPTRLRLRRDLRALLTKNGTPAILVTHDRAEALAMGDTVAVVIDGQVRQTGGISDVFSRPADAEIAASLGIEAVLPAQVAGSSGGVMQIAVGRVMLDAVEREPMAPGAAVYACVRAEDVTLETRAPGQASTRNHLPARVVAIASEGPVERVTLDCGFPIDALITRRSRDELNLTSGAAVTAAIKATAVHVVPRF
jgi:molybdate transport system ATP-binding protein